MAKRLQYRYYGLFAVNPKDPSDFYGYCENSFQWDGSDITLMFGKV